MHRKKLYEGIVILLPRVILLGVIRGKNISVGVVRGENGSGEAINPPHFKSPPTPYSELLTVDNAIKTRTECMGLIAHGAISDPALHRGR
jgi:hypothetical protein